MKNVRPLLYVSFDQVPSAKGASTHIEANARAIGGRFGSLVLVTPGASDQPVRDFAPGVRQIVLGCPDRDVLGRAMTFRAKLRDLLARQAFDVIHFRGIFEGYPLARSRRTHGASLLYEVNGLPSIELKYANPRIRGDALLLSRLRSQEDACLVAADRIVTVSEVNRRCLLARGVEAGRIEVIPNGVDLDVFTYQEPPTARDEPLRVLYCGTMSFWQGVDQLLEALPLVRLRLAIHLDLVGPAPRARRDDLERRLRRRGLAEVVTFHGAQPRGRVVELLHDAHVCVVPLSAVDRNTEQGCCPLKLIEAAAAGCPVIASDLPVVRELFRPREHYHPVAPDDPAGLALALWDVGEESRERARRARAHVERHYTWRRSTDALLAVYEGLLATPASSCARLRSSASSE